MLLFFFFFFESRNREIKAKGEPFLLFFLFSAKGEKAIPILAKAERMTEIFGKAKRETKLFSPSFSCLPPRVRETESVSQG